ncbi:MAG: vWA domain-containing protein [Coriobacteriales bacterium]|jgi:hypothetical protein
MKKGATELVLIIDRSGSMSGLESDTIGGINGILREHRQLDENCLISIVLFNHTTKALFDRQPIYKVRNLTESDYKPAGSTALLDAVGNSISHISKVQGYLPEEFRAEHVIFAITTDGLENSSKKFTKQELRKLIEAKQEMGWEFLYLGANVDAFEEGASIGIARDRIANYVPDDRGTERMFHSIAVGTARILESPGRIDGSWADDVNEDYESRK